VKILEREENTEYDLTRQSKLIANGFKFKTLRDSGLTQKRLPCALKTKMIKYIHHHKKDNIDIEKSVKI